MCRDGSVLLSTGQVCSFVSVCSICQTVGVQTNGDPQHTVCKSNIGIIYGALLAALGDYAMDSRGDVGSW